MIDVVFLLLVFFMLASRFGQDNVLPLVAGVGAETWDGAPRLISVSDEGYALNGQEVQLDTVAGSLQPLMPDTASPVIVQATGDADLSALTALFDVLRAAGITNLVLVE
jgi:biopolymer transport protein ExbD